MKAWMFWFGLVLIVGCADQNTDPVTLHKTWQRVGSTTNGEPDTSTWDTRELIVEFRSDGKLLYGLEKSESGCCRYDTFTQTESTLTFEIRENRRGCETVKCAPSPFFTATPPWLIETLTENRLVLRAGGKVMMFRSV
jgi:hypothetical protein